MGTRYSQLSTEDRNRIHGGLNLGLSRREVGSRLGRAPSTISQEATRGGAGAAYDAASAAQQARRRRGRRELVAGTALLQEVHGDLLGGWSPEQIAGRLKQMYPDELSERVSQGTIYRYIYAQPRGELRGVLIAALRLAQNKMPRIPNT